MWKDVKQPTCCGRNNRPLEGRSDIHDEGAVEKVGHSSNDINKISITDIQLLEEIQLLLS